MIIKYYNRCVIPDYQDVALSQWAEASVVSISGRRPGVRVTDISKDKAREFIEKLGLVLVKKSKDGECYDTPDGSFREYCRKYNIQLEKNI